MAGRRLVGLVVLLGVAVVAFGGLAAWGAIAYTSSPAFCASCHVMETRHISWRRSAHFDRATCIQCHSEPGRWGEVKAHLNGARYLYVMLTGEKSGPILRASVERATCEQCHRLDALPERQDGVEIRHATHLTRGLECAACHAGLVHGALHAPARVMETCAGCHAPQSPVLERAGAPTRAPHPTAALPEGS